MVPSILFLSALVALSDTLIIPISPPVRSTQNNHSFSPLPALKPFTLSNPATLTLPPVSKSNTTAQPPPSLATWPHLPFTSDTGHNLNITISRLGPITPRARWDEIINSISDLYHVMASEGDPYETIRGVYARSSGVVWTIFACGPEVAMKRHQAVQVMGAVWIFMFDYGPREVVLSEITTAEGRLASFVLRFLHAGR